MKPQSYEIEMPTGEVLELAYHGDDLLAEPPEARAFVERIVRMMEGAAAHGFLAKKRKAAGPAAKGGRR